MATRAKLPPRVRKEWTLKQAQAAQERFVARGGRRFGDPRSPLSQWWAMHDLDKEEARFQHGERYALAMALRICANHVLPLPPWAASAYIQGFDVVHTYRADSWDVLFGPAIPKGQHLKALRKRLDKSIAVWSEVQHRHKAGKPIDDKLFADVGKKLGIGTTLAKEYYGDEKRYSSAMHEALDQPDNPLGELLRPYHSRPKK